MTQATTWSVPLSGPATPDEFAARIDDSLDALLSSNSGSTRPSYAVPGTMWVSDAVAGSLSVYLYDGTTDRLIQTIDTTTGDITFSGGTVAGNIDFDGNEARNVTVTGDVGGQLLRGHLYGLSLANNATDATNDIDIATGSAASDGTTPHLMVLSSALTKRLDATWAVGSGNGGLDTGAIANTTYHVWLIQRSDTGVVDCLFSTSVTSPTMPTNYDRKRRIGSIIRESAAIVVFSQLGDTFLRAAKNDMNTSPGTTAIPVALSVPAGLEVTALIRGDVIDGGAGSIAGGLALLTSLREADRVPSTIPGDYDAQVYFTNSTPTAFKASLITNSSRQIRVRAGNATVGVRIATYGWIDTRGRT